MNTRKAIITKTVRDFYTGETTTIHYRAFQPIKKDGTDAKAAPRITSKQLVILPDGSRRFYNSNGVLQFERVTAERFELERATPTWREEIGA